LHIDDLQNLLLVLLMLGNIGK